MDPNLLVSPEDNKNVVKIKNAVIGFLNILGLGDDQSVVAKKLTNVVFLRLFLNLVIKLEDGDKKIVVDLYNNNKLEEVVAEIRKTLSNDEVDKEVINSIKVALNEELNELKSNLKPNASTKLEDYILNYQ